MPTAKKKSVKNVEKKVLKECTVNSVSYVRENPSKSSKPLAILEKGHVLSVVSIENDWVKVCEDKTNIYGYILKDLVDIIY